MHTMERSKADVALVSEANLVPLGYQQIATATLAASTGLTVPAGAVLALIVVEGGQAVRWRDDGQDPSSTVGMPIADGGSLPYSGDLSAIKFIRVAAGAIVNASYYR